MVSYDKQTINTKNIFARYAHRTRLSISKNIITKNYINKDISILDYGCGDGIFLDQLSKIFKNSKLIGYDPYSKINHNSFLLLNNLDEISKNKFDIICCFETLEHLFDSEKSDLYELVKNSLNYEGKFIVSVPIIGGLTLILKEFNRAIMFKRKSDYTFKELFLSTFFNKSPKRAVDIKGSHKGFNFTKLETELNKNFTIKSKILSPFKNLPWFLNSNIFYILECK